jgi:hypothetical protein
MTGKPHNLRAHSGSENKGYRTVKGTWFSPHKRHALSSIHTGVWSLAFSQPRTWRSTSALVRRLRSKD